MSDGLVIRPAQSRADRRAWLYLPRRLYRDDPNWVPPLWGHQKELVGFKKHPFYQQARARAFLAVRGGEPVGRILAIVNEAHNRRYDEKRGFFGFFESEDDPAIAQRLLAAVERWHQQQGMQSLRGPVNPSLNYECGLLVDGFDSPPTFMMTYNPPYYERLLQACGLEKTQDLFAYDIDTKMLETVDPKLRFIIDESKKRFGVKLRTLDRKNFDRDVRLFLHIYNQSLQNTWGYVPMSDAEIDHTAKGLRFLIAPELTSIAEIDGKPIGSGFGLLDFNPLIRDIGGRLFPFGWLRLLMGKKKLHRMRLISTNVLPEWQKWGLGLVVWEAVLPRALQRGIREGELSWVLESNSLSRGTIERGGGRLEKTYRLYDKAIEGAPEQ